MKKKIPFLIFIVLILNLIIVSNVYAVINAKISNFKKDDTQILPLIDYSAFVKIKIKNCNTTIQRFLNNIKNVKQEYKIYYQDKKMIDTINKNFYLINRA